MAFVTARHNRIYLFMPNGNNVIDRRQISCFPLIRYISIFVHIPTKLNRKEITFRGTRNATNYCSSCVFDWRCDLSRIDCLNRDEYFTVSPAKPLRLNSTTGDTGWFVVYADRARSRLNSLDKTESRMIHLWQKSTTRLTVSIDRVSSETHIHRHTQMILNAIVH